MIICLLVNWHFCLFQLIFLFLNPPPEICQIIQKFQSICSERFSPPWPNIVRGFNYLGVYIFLLVIHYLIHSEEQVQIFDTSLLLKMSAFKLFANCHLSVLRFLVFFLFFFLIHCAAFLFRQYFAKFSVEKKKSVSRTNQMAKTSLNSTIPGFNSTDWKMHWQVDIHYTSAYTPSLRTLYLALAPIFASKYTRKWAVHNGWNPNSLGFVYLQNLIFWGAHSVSSSCEKWFRCSTCNFFLFKGSLNNCNLNKL